MVCSSVAVDSPVVLGFFRPVLLLPEWLLPTLSAEDFQQIAWHELEHLRRGDDWTNLLLQIGLMLFPLHPALLWFNRRIGVQRELACDAAVVAATERPVDYASSLARLAEYRLKRNTLRFALAAWGRQSELSQRIHALLKQSREWSATQRAVGAAAVACTLIAAAAGLSHAPQLVRVELPSQPLMASHGSAILPQPEAVTSVLSSHVGAAAQFVPASYTVPSHDSARRISVHHTPQARPQRMAHLVPASAAMVQDVEFSSFRMEEVSATIAPESSMEARPSQARVRAVPTLYTSTYLAVPVSSGWILIQL